MTWDGFQYPAPCFELSNFLFHGSQKNIAEERERDAEQPVLHSLKQEKATAELPTTPRRRLVELDALRGVAAILVVLYHYLTRYDELLGHSTQFPYSFSWGWVGVEIFFVLSGFVIYMSLDRNTTCTDFVASRMIRLYPTYWVGIILTTTVIMFIGLPSWNVSTLAIVANFSMLHSFALLPSVDGAYWSLSEELKFYALMVFFKLIGQIGKPLRICVVWLLVAGLFGFGMKVVDEGVFNNIFKAGYILCSAKYCFWFISGIAFYGIWKDKSNVQYYLILALNWIYYGLAFGNGAIPLAMIVLSIFAAVIFLRPAFMSSRVLLFLGAISYPLYLIHQNIGYCIIKSSYELGFSGYVGVVVAIAVAILLGWLIHRFVELPSGKFLRSVYRSWKEKKLVEATVG